MNLLLYRVLWGLGVTPWERLQAFGAEQVSLMFDREEQRRQPPYGAALDLGSGTGWSVVDEQPFDTSGMPAVFNKANPRWYRLRRD